MLERLFIKNLAIISSLEIEFDSGFNVITGETGAGKSIIIGALSFVLGEKVYSSIIRSGEDKAIVEASFNISKNDTIKSLLNFLGIEYDDLLTLKREINKNGQSRAFANSQSITIRQLKDIGNILVDLHGQHEHQYLFDINYHIDILDEFGNLIGDREILKGMLEEYREIENKYRELQKSEEERQKEIDYLEYAISEIKEANIHEGEDEELEREIKMYENYELINEAIASIIDMLYEREESASTLIDLALEKLNKVKEFDSDIAKYYKMIEDIRNNIDEIVSWAGGYIDNIDYNPEEHNKKIERLELIKDLKKKYTNNGSITDLINYAEEAKSKLESLKDINTSIDRYKKQLNELYRQIKDFALSLSKKRQEIAKRLESLIEKELYSLALGGARCKIEFKYVRDENSFLQIKEDKIKITEKGIDRVEILIETNKGEGLKPLRKIASGGEISRIMLAIKKIIASKDMVDVLVFDEVDSGIGGKTAIALANSLYDVSKNKQLICITHLPQIAAKANTHLYVAKEEKNGRVIASISRISGDDRVREIARMLSGVESEASLKHARELLNIN